MTSSKPTCPTHPFIDFNLDLRKLNPHDWLLLGEASSKIAHIIGVPLQPDVAERLHGIALVKGVRATTAIEGNTLTEEQVRAIHEKRLTLPPSKEYLQREVQNVLDACNSLLAAHKQDKPPAIDSTWIKAQNARMLYGLSVEPEVAPGEWRAHVVGVSRYRAPEPKYVEPLMSQFVRWLEELDTQSQRESSMHCSVQILRAIVAHLYIAWIHPFGDGNGRTARMLEFALLLAAGVPSASAHILSNHYNETRAAYYRELERASAASDIFGFIHYSLVGLVDGLREQIQVIQQQQLRVTWTEFVYKTLDPKSDAEKRRAHLAIDLAQHGATGVATSDLLSLSSRLTRAYAVKTEKTLTRDLNALREQGLMVTGNRRWYANLDRVRAFQPFTTNATRWTLESTRNPAEPEQQSEP
jgi:Fic family protein